MNERPDINRDSADPRPAGVAVSAPDVKQWFIREVLPLEAALMQYLQHNWRNKSEIADIQQVIYLRVFRAAQENGLPERPKQFVFATARNLLINRVRDENVVPIDAVADLEALEAAAETPGPDRVAQAVAGKLLAPINHDYIPNLKNPFKSAQNPFYDQGSQYTVPYNLYSTGIGWRNDKIKEDIGKIANPWSMFWD